MDGRFAPEEWNYYESLNHTTTNAVESTNWRVFLKTGTRNPNIYSSIGVIKQDLKETEKLLDLLQLGRLKKRVDTNFDQKMEQKRRLKTMLEDQQTDLKSYMTAMGALNIHLDQKTKDRIELLKANGAEGNSSIQNLAVLALNDQILNVLDPAGLYGETADGAGRGRGRGRVRGGDRGRGRGRGRGNRGHHAGTLLDSGRVECNACLRTYVQARFQG